MPAQRITVLGATGSIGVSTLDVVARHPDLYQIFALTAHQQIDKLFEQCQRFCPQYAVLSTADLAAQLQTRLRDAGLATVVLYGPQALCDVASANECDTVMAAIVGAAGLPASLAAAKAGKRVLLANKESLVMSGRLFMDAIARSGSALLPIDSEHNAIFQCLPGGYGRKLEHGGIAKIILTASGGPFLKRALDTLDAVTPEQAVAHPNWVMGRKISVDSATMMNKGLEVIEAHWLFGAPADKIDVLIHPQSVVHSMVSYVDGSVMAQLGNPDMRTPIAYGLAFPERIDSGVEALDLTKFAQLHFEKPDFARFPCLRLAYEALRAGGSAPTILNAANEIAVEAFLGGRLGFRRIENLIEETMNAVGNEAVDSLDAILASDGKARQIAISILSQWSQ
ncbi:1-deoxy-D-xylulose-5-phosphate reductoisomerase [Undibacterium cyanobacteriorum]|uniref:1-deoxy-D-xylulose 5-phosphate reductoisomerase n=1 Tax=Undibacterium cyanobacteriorum TaxID=3073561 RepID=A0ABY9RPR1_9BURK|nr:1-deoxy-D-xylulose-5-phosphate reductoisomerase [Undibacterium sp. 20NA77.5]WMW82437.1 1-deoxy-D-xylulose-5-phosphate reductoisomerase [Undibacterium sp. 20NA77.5]